METGNMDKDRLSRTCCMYNDSLEKDTFVSIACLSKFTQIPEWLVIVFS